VKNKVATPGQSSEKQHRWRRIHPGYVILILLMGLFAFKFMQKTQEVRTLAGEEAALQYQNQLTAYENSSLQRSIRYYRTSQYVKEQARAAFQMVLPGDTIIEPNVIHPKHAPRPHIAFRAVQAPDPTWQQWWKAFFG
jgi:cell division protein FtsB